MYEKALAIASGLGDLRTTPSGIITGLQCNEYLACNILILWHTTLQYPFTYQQPNEAKGKPPLTTLALVSGLAIAPINLALVESNV